MVTTEPMPGFIFNIPNFIVNGFYPQNFLYCAVPENNHPRMVIGNLHNSVNKIYRYKIRNLKDNICFQKSTQLFCSMSVSIEMQVGLITKG